MRKLNSFAPFITVLILILVTLAASCDKRNPPLIIPPVPGLPPASDLRVISKIYADVDTIYADMNYTSARISVQVKDGNGFGVPSQAVEFKTNIGRILSVVGTDSTGIATTTFWDNGDIGLATIEARVRNFHPEIADSVLSEVSATYPITVIPVPEVASITFFELPSNPVNNHPTLTLTVMQSYTL
ncbi:MAG: hypothetical protein U1C33_00825, partial [Candidatus Cloacimonadaceae bacterium]|nr:hypothetical protein [Candidatus Cloacimonadaceae bacterium]